MSNNAFIVVIGVIASIITIFSFLFGEEKLNNYTDRGSNPLEFERRPDVKKYGNSTADNNFTGLDKDLTPETNSSLQPTVNKQSYKIVIHSTPNDGPVALSMANILIDSGFQARYSDVHDSLTISEYTGGWHNLIVYYDGSYLAAGMVHDILEKIGGHDTFEIIESSSACISTRMRRLKLMKDKKKALEGACYSFSPHLIRVFLGNTNYWIDFYK